MNDNKLLAKLKIGGWTDERISAKMGIPKEEVQKRWLAIKSIADSRSTAGMAELVGRFTSLCHQYELLGEGLKNFSLLLSSQVEYTEMKSAMPSLKEEDAIWILQNYLVFRHPFLSLPPPPPLPESN